MRHQGPKKTYLFINYLFLKGCQIYYDCVSRVCYSISLELWFCQKKRELRGELQSLLLYDLDDKIADEYLLPQGNPWKTSVSPVGGYVITVLKKIK